MPSPWDMDLNDRKLTAKLLACLAGRAQDEIYYRKSEELCGAIQNFLEEITTEIPLPVAYDLDVDMDALSKLFTSIWKSRAEVWLKECSHS